MTVTSMVEFGDRLIAAGNVYGTTPVGVANPVVWTSTNGGPWERSWDAGQIVGGSSSNPHLVVLGHEVWMFHSGTGGTVAWRSVDGLEWTPAPPDDAMAPVAVLDAAARDGVVVAVSANKFVRLNVLWVSPDGGTSWEQRGSSLGPNAAPSSIAATKDGFVVTGVDLVTLLPVVWTSPDGEDWTRATLDTKAGQIWSVAASNGAVVVDGTADNQPATWYRDGDSWSRADTTGTQTFTAAPNSRLQSIRDGFVSIDARPYALRFSRDGKTWTDVVSANAPDATVVLGAAAGDSLVVWIGESNGAGREVMRPWRVDFR
jgi:hypothetical protein